MPDTPLRCALAATHHDPDGSLHDQLARALPTLRRIFSGIAVQASEPTNASSLALLSVSGAIVRRAPAVGHTMLGRARRGAVELGLEIGAPHMLFCDLDRALHWAEHRPAELAQAAAALGAADMTVLGRTPAAFSSHPRTQRDTEAIVNRCFAQVAGHSWDITAAARGLSRRAAAAIVADCHEQSVGSDGVWPLFCARAGLTLAYLEVDGLEFETPDRCGPAIAAAGGLEPWLAQLDRDTGEWALRLAIAAAEVGALQPYVRR